MVTEELPVACSTCFSDDTPSLPSTPLPSAPLSRTTSGSFDKENDVQVARQFNPNASEASGFSYATINTPPESPRIAALQPSPNGNGHRRDSSFRKTYDEADRKRAIPCENCALTLPKKVTSQLPPTAGSSTSSPKALDNNDSPVLRTRKPYELISLSTSASPSSKSSDSDEPDRAHAHSERKPRRRSMRRSVTSSSASSISSATSPQHAHYLDYTSTHDPLTSSSFSLLRAACLRTLSCETLPPTRSPSSPSPYSAVSSPGSALGKTFAPPPGASASGGPIFFGDPLAGYTTAFIFRIPDPCARGRRRVYALLCLSQTGERKAMRAFGVLAGAFRELAGWMQGLAEAEADRMEVDGEQAGGGEGLSRGLKEARAGSVNADRERVPTSSFLSGRQAGGYESEGGRGVGMGMGIRGVRSRGLAELVGRPDFFIELHVRFVALLAQLRFLIDGN